MSWLVAAMHSKSVTLLLIMAVGGFVLANSYQLLHVNFLPAPIVVEKAEAVTREVVHGGTLEYALWVRKDRECPATYDLHFVSPDGHVKTGAVSRRGGKFPVSKEPVRRALYVDLPKGVWLGGWTLEVKGWANCPERTWPVDHPTIEFEVIAKEGVKNGRRKGQPAIGSNG